MKVECAYDELVAIAKLIPNPKNPNQHPEKQIKLLAKIMKHQGVRSPIVVSNRSGFITKGHGRLLAAAENAWENFPVDFQDYESEALEYADMVADNMIAELSESNMGMIVGEAVKLGEDFDFDLLGIPDFELPTIVDAQTAADEIPENAEKRAKPGDIFECGTHRIMCGDATSVDHVKKLLKGKTAELVFTDPPYRMEAEGGSNQPVGKAARKLGERIKDLCDFDPDAFLNTLVSCFDSKKMNAYIFCNKDLVPDYLNWAVEAGFSFNILFWKKPNAIPLGGSHRPDTEYLLLFRKSATWNNGIQGVTYSKCLEFARVLDREENGGHPTAKPVGLIENEILISSSKGGLVVDLFGGSGSTMIACEKSGRACRMMELDPKYVDVVLTRWERFTGKKAKLFSE